MERVSTFAFHAGTGVLRGVDTLRSSVPTNLPNVNSVQNLFGGSGTASPPEPPSFLSTLQSELTLSYSKRVVAFITFLLLGVLFCYVSTFFILSPRRFAKFYTFGSLMLLGSTFFLMGPWKQLRSMTQRSRLPATILYFLAIAGTLWAALSLQRTGATMVFVVIQFLAAFWYAASYIPFCHNIITSSAKTVLPL
ncbi:Vesicle transport protein SFT2B [Balamuthia mandrillaris]